MTIRLAWSRSLAAGGIALVLSACGSGSEAPTGRTSTSGGSPGGSNAGAYSSSAAIGDVQCGSEDCGTMGGFTPPFVEPVVFDRDPTTPARADGGGTDIQAKATNGLPIKNPLRRVPMDDRCERMPDGRPVNCKPTGASLAMLTDGRVLYFNALEGTENVELSIVAEAGQVVVNDQTRVLTMTGNKATWTMPSPFDAGADTEAECLLPGCLLNTDTRDPVENSGALFCSDLEQLPDGRILAVGGTNYYFEPGIASPPIGVSELEGIRSSRIFNPRTNRWDQTASMNYGRWYPTLVPLPSGDIFVASGVTKLLKPVYLPTEEHPMHFLDTLRNVTQTETFDLGCQQWTDNGPLGQRTLPLYPRLHLLPNGQVYYNAAGQAFNPFGQAYDMALWNIVAAYDPQTKSWTDLGYAGLPLQLNANGAQSLVSALNPSNTRIAASLTSLLTGLVGRTIGSPQELLGPVQRLLGADVAGNVINAVAAGFRGSTFSIMLPLKMDSATGEYNKAEFLTGGGVLGAITATSPGSYVTVPFSRIDTVNIDGAGGMRYVSRLTGTMRQPRWYGTGVLLPNGQVIVFSGADRDEVVLPGTGRPVMRSEMFDPETETWTPMALQAQPRTYHNTAMLLPDGRVLVGGHSPINTAYAFSINLPGLSPNDGRDPTFEIYSPPYMFKPRPRIDAAPATLAPGQSFSVSTPQGSSIESVVLVRNTSLTHLVDGAQRNVELKIVRRAANSVDVVVPGNSAVVPPGPYLLFINQRSDGSLVPSVSRQLTVTGADSRCEG